MADSGNDRIQKFDSDGNFILKWGTHGSGDGEFDYPNVIFVGPDGSVFVIDEDNGRVQKFDSSGNFIMEWGNWGSGDGQLSLASGLAVGLDGSIYVADSGNNRIQKFDRSGNFIMKWERNEDGDFTSPAGIAVSPDGALYVIDHGNSSIQRMEVEDPLDGIITGRVTASSTSMPLTDVAVTIEDLIHTITTRTDQSGTYTITGLASGDFKATFRKSGYVGKTVTGTLIADETRNIAVQLPPAPPLILTISHPHDGDIISTYSGSISVGGYVNNDAHVTINGVMVSVNWDTFEAYDGIALGPGDNTILVTATDIYGQTESRSINVYIIIQGDINVFVTDSMTGLPLASATISVTDSSNITRTALTDIWGHYNFSRVTIGPFTGSIEKSGYDPYSFSGSLLPGQSFLVAAALSPIAPIISNIAVRDLTAASATISWITNQPADSLVEYGETSSYGRSASGFALTTSHEIVLAPLNPGTVYHYRVTSRNIYGVAASSQDQIFSTASAPPVISNISVTGITASSATVSWTTDQAADSRVDYGTTISYGSSTSDPALVTSHQITLGNLTPGTPYHYRVISTNASGLASASGDRTFSTSTPTTQISLSITSPVDDGTVSKSAILVEGRVANATGNETGVVINGVMANIYAGEFVANHVPLVEGANVITATATDVRGNTATASVNLTSVRVANYMRLTANAEVGISPLEIALTLESSLPLTSASLTYTGPGEVELLSSSPTEYRLRMTTEGIYRFTTTVTDAGGTAYEDTMAIIVMPKNDLENLLASTWNRMKAALMAGDPEGALGYILVGSQDKYREIFLRLHQQEIDAIFSNNTEFKLYTFFGGVAGCGAIRQEAGGPYSYPVTFVQDENGIWKIAGL